jgi:serine/threonine protein kinase
MFPFLLTSFLLYSFPVSAFGAVFKGRHREAGFVLAIKEVKNMSKEAEETLEKEIEVLKQCKHPNIVSYYGSCSHTSLWILMDFCSGGSVRDLIEVCNRPLEEQQMAVICYGTLKGLTYLHTMNIVHRDVKAANILLTEDAEIKIGKNLLPLFLLFFWFSFL